MLTINQVYIYLAIFINKKNYETGDIKYSLYRKTEERLFNRIKDINGLV